MNIKSTKHPLITIFENVFDKTTLDELIESFKKEKNWDYNINQQFPNEIKNVLLNSEAEKSHNKVFSLVLLVCDMFSQYFGEAYCSVQPSVRRWEKGELQTPHMDNMEPDGKVAMSGNDGSVSADSKIQTFYPYPIIDFTALIYLNDNYSGGEICFPDQGIEIKPKAGSVIIWPAAEKHAVNKILEGHRYTVVCFLIKARILSVLQFYELSSDWRSHIVNPQCVDECLPSNNN